jgi:hypothetical protein
MLLQRQDSKSCRPYAELESEKSWLTSVSTPRTTGWVVVFPFVTGLAFQVTTKSSPWESSAVKLVGPAFPECFRARYPKSGHDLCVSGDLSDAMLTFSVFREREETETRGEKCFLCLRYFRFRQEFHDVLIS